MRIRGYRSSRRNFLPSLIKTGLIILFLLSGFYILRNRDYLIDTLGGRGRVAILFYTSKDSVLAVLDGDADSLNLVGIPSELYSELSADYGDYRFGAVFKLGEIDGKGKSLVRMAAYNVFAIGIDGVVLMNKDFDIGTDNQLPPKIRQEIFGGLLRGSNLGYFKFWWKAKTLKPSDIKFFNLRISDSVSDLVLPDNSKALKFDSYYFDKQIGSIYLRDSLAVSEKLNAEILNGSEIPGLGERTGRYLANLGVNVFSVSNSDEEVGNCKIKFSRNIKNSYSLFRIAKDLGCTFETYGVEEVPKTDLTIVLGKSSSN